MDTLSRLALSLLSLFTRLSVCEFLSSEADIEAANNTLLIYYDFEDSEASEATDR